MERWACVPDVTSVAPGGPGVAEVWCPEVNKNDHQRKMSPCRFENKRCSGTVLFTGKLQREVGRSRILTPVSPLLLPGLPLPRWAWGGTRRWLPRKPSAQRSHTSTSSRGARVRFPLRLLGFRAEQAVCGCEWYRVCAQRAPLTRPPGDPVRATLAAMDLGTEMVPFGAPHYQPTYPKNCLTCLYSKIILGSG